VPTVVNTQHGRGCGESWKHRWQFRLANRWTKRIVGVSEDSARRCRLQDRAAASKMIRIWNGIDVNRFAFHGPADRPVAISVARLSKEKDFPTLLRGIAKALPQIPEFQLKLVGDGVERPRLEQLSRDLGLQQVVEFLGERSDVPELLRQAGLFVSSSKTEGVSLTLLEAMAVGLPVLTTTVGGNPEVVEDGVTGRLVEPLNPDAIAAGLVEMFRRRDEWRDMGACGRQRVERNFEVGGMVQAYERLYGELLQT
jgi:glycosyltransferase involved in cell wall biosynthesis